MVVSVQFPADRRPHPRHNWHGLLAVTAEGMSAEWAGAPRGSFLPHERETELGKCCETARVDEAEFLSLLQQTLSLLLAECCLHVAEIRETVHGTEEQDSWS